MKIKMKIKGIPIHEFWFKPRKSFFGSYSGIGFVPKTIEGWITEIVFIIVFLFMFFYFKIWDFILIKFINFIFLTGFLFLLFFIISKNTTPEKNYNNFQNKKKILNFKKPLKKFNKPFSKKTSFKPNNKFK